MAARAFFSLVEIPLICESIPKIFNLNNQNLMNGILHLFLDLFQRGIRETKKVFFSTLGKWEGIFSSLHNFAHSSQMNPNCEILLDTIFHLCGNELPEIIERNNTHINNKDIDIDIMIPPPPQELFFFLSQSVVMEKFYAEKAAKVLLKITKGKRIFTLFLESHCPLEYSPELFYSSSKWEIRKYFYENLKETALQ
jgi:hypothetical protein